MRVFLPLALAALTVAGCAYQPAAPAPAPVPVPVAPPADPVTPAMRSAATQVVNREMARRLPGVNVAPYTNCVMQNATMAEVMDLASMSAGDNARAAGAVASVVQRPGATQCIAAVARTA